MKNLLILLIAVMFFACGDGFRDKPVSEHMKTLKKTEYLEKLNTELSDAEVVIYTQNAKLIMKSEGVFELTKYSIQEIIDYEAE